MKINKRHILLAAFIHILFTPLANAENFKSCNRNHDCIVTFDAWCDLPVALNKKHFIAWQKYDKKSSIRAEEQKQTCKASNDKALYTTWCENKSCTFGIVKKPN